MYSWKRNLNLANLLWWSRCIMLFTLNELGWGVGPFKFSINETNGTSLNRFQPFYIFLVDQSHMMLAYFNFVWTTVLYTWTVTAGHACLSFLQIKPNMHILLIWLGQLRLFSSVRHKYLYLVISEKEVPPVEYIYLKKFVLLANARTVLSELTFIL